MRTVPRHTSVPVIVPSLRRLDREEPLGRRLKAVVPARASSSHRKPSRNPDSVPPLNGGAEPAYSVDTQSSDASRTGRGYVGRARGPQDGVGQREN